MDLKARLAVTCGDSMCAEGFEFCNLCAPKQEALTELRRLEAEVERLTIEVADHEMAIGVYDEMRAKLQRDEKQDASNKAYAASLRGKVDAMEATRAHDKLKIEGLEKRLQRYEGAEVVEGWVDPYEFGEVIINPSTIWRHAPDEIIPDDHRRATLLIHPEEE